MRTIASFTRTRSLGSNGRSISAAARHGQVPRHAAVTRHTWLWIGLGAVVLIALAVLVIAQTGGGAGGGAGRGFY